MNIKTLILTRCRLIMDAGCVINIGRVRGRGAPQPDPDQSLTL